MANLVVCADGTWNTPSDKDGGVPSPTNVVKFHGAVDLFDSEGADQPTYYHPGVGTKGSLVDRLAGGGMGVGLGDAIKSAYKWLAVNYKPGDRIYLLGFSRGAYTVRSLAGMITSCGLANLSPANLAEKTMWSRVDQIYENYRHPTAKRESIKNFRFYNTPKGANGAGKTKIHFLGVWDTVGALGIPDHMSILNLMDDAEEHMFHDTRLSSNVTHARHALAIDERRESFRPTMWSSVGKRANVKQIWFAGVHSDVGGGYAETGLSDNALMWMIQEAEQCGLRFRDGAVDQIAPDPRGVLHDSLTGVFKVLKSRPRNVPHMEDQEKARLFHASALERHRNPPLAQPRYWPTQRLGPKKAVVIDVFARERWNSTGVYLKAKERYRFRAKGEWIDSAIICGPSGAADGDFQIGEVLHVGASMLDKMEEIFKQITGNSNSDFWLTRREGQFFWFSLIGVVANGDVTKSNGKVASHESFLIGQRRDFSPKRDGYLYCFANDAWQAYGNNKGSVSLTIDQIG